eukprot:3941178-Rhodomonas_salina.1
MLFRLFGLPGIRSSRPRRRGRPAPLSPPRVCLAPRPPRSPATRASENTQPHSRTATQPHSRKRHTATETTRLDRSDLTAVVSGRGRASCRQRHRQHRRALPHAPAHAPHAVHNTRSAAPPNHSVT